MNADQLKTLTTDALDRLAALLDEGHSDRLTALKAHLRLNLPTQRGEAGAPLLNMKGEVVGIVVSSLENNSACYAVPIEAAEKIRGGRHSSGQLWHQTGGHSPASRTKKSNSTRRCAGCLVLYHRRRHCPDHGDAREPQADL